MGNKALFTAIAAAGVLLAESAFAIQFKVVTPPELMALFVKKGFPQYPYEARRSHIQGAGLFRLYVNEMEQSPQLA